MKSARLFLTLSIFLSTCTLIGAEEHRSSIKLGVGFSGFLSGYGINADVASPRLFTVSRVEGKWQSDIHAFLGMGLHSVFNQAQSGNTFRHTNLETIALGLKAQIVPYNTWLSPYTALALDVLFFDSALSSKSVCLGFRGIFGVDLFYVRGTETLFGISDTSFFVQGDVVFFHSKANRIVGEPEVYAGFSPQVGFRSHF